MTKGMIEKLEALLLGETSDGWVNAMGIRALLAASREEAKPESMDEKLHRVRTGRKG